MADEGGSAPSTPRPRLRELVSTRPALVAVVLVTAILFVVQNDQRVRIHFLVVTVSSRLWIGFIVCLVLGGLLGQLVGLLRHRR